MKRKEAGMSCRQFVLQQDVPLREKAAYVPCSKQFIETAHCFRRKKGMIKGVLSESRHDY
jgi:hypothetical protein